MILKWAILHMEHFHFWYFMYILMLILLYFYLNAELLLVTECFYTVELSVSTTACVDDAVRTE